MAAAATAGRSLQQRKIIAGTRRRRSVTCSSVLQWAEPASSASARAQAASGVLSIPRLCMAGPGGVIAPMGNEELRPMEAPWRLLNGPPMRDHARRALRLHCTCATLWDARSYHPHVARLTHHTPQARGNSPPSPFPPPEPCRRRPAPRAARRCWVTAVNLWCHYQLTSFELQAGRWHRERGRACN